MRWVTGAIAALHLAAVIQVLRDTHADEAVPRPWGPRDLAAAAASGGTSGIERLAAPLLPWLRCARLVAAASGAADAPAWASLGEEEGSGTTWQGQAAGEERGDGGDDGIAILAAGCGVGADNVVMLLLSAAEGVPLRECRRAAGGVRTSPFGMLSASIAP